jgi:hypothetical protein
MLYEIIIYYKKYFADPIWGLVPVGIGGGYRERVSKGECSRNIMFSCIKMEK